MVAFGSFRTRNMAVMVFQKRWEAHFMPKHVFFLQQALKKQVRLGRNLKGFPLSQWGPYL
jgi:hypothetical protein